MWFPVQKKTWRTDEVLEKVIVSEDVIVMCYIDNWNDINTRHKTLYVFCWIFCKHFRRLLMNNSILQIINLTVINHDTSNAVKRSPIFESFANIRLIALKMSILSAIHREWRSSLSAYATSCSMQAQSYLFIPTTPCAKRLFKCVLGPQ